MEKVFKQSFCLSVNKTSKDCFFFTENMGEVLFLDERRRRRGRAKRGERRNERERERGMLRVR